MNRRSFLKVFATIPLVLGTGYFLYRQKDYFFSIDDPQILDFLKNNKAAIPINELRTFLSYPYPIKISAYLSIDTQKTVLEKFISHLNAIHTDLGFDKKLQKMSELNFEANDVFYIDGWLISNTQVALLILDGYKDVI